MPAQPVSWAARTEEPGGKTSPEELIAAAHASCYAMALPGALVRNEHPPEQLTVTAVVTFAPKPEGGFRVSRSDLIPDPPNPRPDSAAGTRKQVPL